MKLSKKEANLLAIVLAGLAFFIYYKFLLSNYINIYFSLKKDINISLKQLASLQKYENDIDILIEEIQNRKKRIAEMEVLIPSSKKIPEIIAQLENLSKDAGVNLRGIIFESTPKDIEKEQPLDEGQSKQHNYNIIDSDYVEIPMQLYLEGPYNNIISFLEYLESFKRLFNVRYFSLSRRKQDAGENLEMQLGISTYSIKLNDNLMHEPAAYEFMNKNYGRQNPFKSLEMENNTSQIPGIWRKE